MKWLMSFFLLSQVAFAIEPFKEPKMVELMEKAANDYLDERFFMKEVFWSVSIFDLARFEILAQEKDYYHLKIETSGESFDQEFGDPVDSFKGDCFFKLKKLNKQWKVISADCDDKGFDQ